MAGPASDAAAFSVAGGIEAARVARRAVHGLDGAVPASARDDVLLLVTELVTNAVRHGGVGADRSVDVRFERSQHRVRVEVVEPGTDFAPARPRVREAPGGWGLILVDRIADRWGVSSTSSGTCVWFELRVEA
jgi:anti-sigma regulatory factor (Ser/Thr protein kinase)